MTNQQQYGILPMSQGAETYAAISQLMDYDVANMKLSASLSETYYSQSAKTAQSFMDESRAAAEDSGSNYEQDAINNIVQMSVTALGLAGTAFSYYRTRTTELDQQLDDAKLMKSALNDNNRAPELVQKEDGDDEEAEQKKLDLQPKPQEKEVELLEKKQLDEAKARTQKENEDIEKKIDRWKREGGDSLKDYQKKLVDLKGGELASAKENNALNEKAVQLAKSNPEARERIGEKIDERINNLEKQKGKLDSEFTQFTSVVKNMEDLFNSAGQIRQNYKKQELTTAAQTEQASAQILEQVQQKQNSGASGYQNQAEKFAEALASLASSYGQIRQTGG